MSEQQQKDSRLKSLSETAFNIAIGYWINYAANIAILPHFAEQIGKTDFLAFHAIGIIYTFISISRQYGFRRLFEQFGPKENAYTLSVRGLKWLRGKLHL